MYILLYSGRMEYSAILKYAGSAEVIDHRLPGKPVAVFQVLLAEFPVEKVGNTELCALGHLKGIFIVEHVFENLLCHTAVQ